MSIVKELPRFLQEISQSEERGWESPLRRKIDDVFYSALCYSHKLRILRKIKSPEGNYEREAHFPILFVFSMQCGRTKFYCLSIVCNPKLGLDSPQNSFARLVSLLRLNFFH